jgi:L-ascorbate metabolism protein UlaG (beta-lactamase superfamily)
MRVTWFGHSAFLLEAAGKKVLVDPFLTGNPTFASVGDAAAKAARQAVEVGLTHIVLTHGHGDHVGDTIALGLACKPAIFCNYDLGMWLMAKATEANGGVDAGLPFELMNTGGTVENNGVRVTLVRADHSSGEVENGIVSALGLPNGAIIRLPGAPIIWHMGDTDIFSDMALISELYQPEIIMVPIGDRFTMGPETAAHAIRNFLPSAKVIIPCHWGTFGLLTGTPAALKAALGDKARLVADFVPHQTKEL